uniref:Mating-type protein MAT-1 n=1 Tax=Zymoseptoria passerinii TaxID=1047170 RepID=Q86ZV9_9PEZI|nr:MAT-1 protein [Zymoseptoria passerinii]
MSSPICWKYISNHASSVGMGTTLVHSGVTKNSKKPRKQTKADLASLEPPKRPLNAWMGFRNFYLKVLEGLAQKDISKTMTVFWANDPFKSKWALLSKAYSVARGTRAKIDAPLGGFFSLCAPLVGIISPQDYLDMMGWQLSPPKPGENVSFLMSSFLATKTDSSDLDAVPHPHLHPKARGLPRILPEHQLHRGRSRQGLYAAGYVVPNDDTSPSMSAQGSLTMVSKPAVTSVSAPKVSKPTPAPLGRKILAQATSALEQSGAVYPYNNVFNPTTQFDVSFDPAAVDTAVEDGGRWNAFTPMAQSGTGHVR